MTDSGIAKAFKGGLMVSVAGFLLGGAGVFLLLSFGGKFVEVAGNPYIQVFEPRIDGFFWTTLAMVFGGAALFLIGGVVQLAAGIHRLTGGRWFRDKAGFVIAGGNRTAP
jgi:hypothetical protein